MTSVALSIRQPTLNPTRKEIATRKRQELPVQQASLGTALSPGVVRKEEVEDAQPDVLRARIAQKVYVRLASASASVELPVRQSSLAAAHMEVVREEDVEDE
ncbi:hypothetical protein PC121_g14356 [Phytophthora cactorum]|nr:hypothetical protein PC121_g14356 [Phytophthora cactorum]